MWPHGKQRLLRNKLSSFGLLLHWLHESSPKGALTLDAFVTLPHLHMTSLGRFSVNKPSLSLGYESCSVLEACTVLVRV